MPIYGALLENSHARSLHGEAGRARLGLHAGPAAVADTVQARSENGVRGGTHTFARQREQRVIDHVDRTDPR